VLPLLYLHGLSSGDFVPALGQFLGSSKGLSAPVVTKLTEQWKTEQRTFIAAICPMWTTCTCGRTAFTSTSAWSNTNSACSS
jgi:hypothetical protein